MFYVSCGETLNRRIPFVVNSWWFIKLDLEFLTMCYNSLAFYLQSVLSRNRSFGIGSLNMMLVYNSTSCKIFI